MIDNKQVILKESHIKKIFPNLSSSQSLEWFGYLEYACKKYSINNVLRLSAFFANIGIESNNLTILSENLNYKTTERLVAVFPNFFKSTAQATPYLNNPEKLGNYVYDLRLGNQAGEGYKYRGRGLIQLTGKENYTKFAKSIDNLNIIKFPEIVEQKQTASISAAWFFATKGCSSLIDHGEGSFDACVKRINSAKREYDQRLALFKKCIRIFTETSDTVKEDPVIAPSNVNDIWTNPTPDATVSDITEPSSQAKSKYPYNMVFESRSGHIVEFDDSPDDERINLYHRSGSYYTMLKAGDVVQKSRGKHTTLYDSDYLHNVKGNETKNIIGQSYEKCQSKIFNIAGGTFTIESDTNVQMNAPTITVSQTIAARNGEFDQLSSPNIADLKSRDAVHADYASAIGGAGGAFFNSLMSAIDFSGGSIFSRVLLNNQVIQFKTYCAFTQPVLMPIYRKSQLPPPIMGGTCLYIPDSGINPQPLPVYSNGIIWYTATGAALT